MSTPIEPIDPWLSKMTPSGGMLWLSAAYAEAALLLCEALVADDFTRQYTSTRVIQHLCRHATELYLKGAISAKTDALPPTTHRLDRLYGLYTKLYPDEEFHFDIPFGHEVLDSDGGLFPESLEAFRATHDQRYRYPIDVKGAPFKENSDFDIESYTEKVNVFKHAVNLLVAKIYFKWNVRVRH